MDQIILNKIARYFGLRYKPFFSTQPLRKVCIANRNNPYSVLFNFGHIRRWHQYAVYILYSKISTDPGLLKIRRSHRFVSVVIQILIPFVKK